jgi:iron-sulfur cluster repair protein YtfE (RIC family)
MNAFELLKNDHEKVSAIFENVEATSASDAALRQSMFAQLKTELEIHAHIEETIFYPALREASEAREIVIEALEEHQEVKDLLAELDGMPVDTDEWSERMEELREGVEHHVAEEEGEMFDKAREVLSQQQLADLGQRMAAEKNRYMVAGAS